METKINSGMKISNLDGLQRSNKENLNSNPIQKGKGPSFAELLEKQAKTGALDKPTLKKELSGIKFSNHALDRIRSRGITMGPEQLAKLESAVNKAQEKGAKETLVLMDSTALIVNIKNKTVVTALDQSMMKENVFTNIDSTVVL